jgi:hypothetical protein
MSERLEEALKSIIWYDCHYEWLETLANKIENTEAYFVCPFEIEDWHKERHVIYMLLVGMFGNWGTSIRGGWIEETKECAEYIRELCKDMKELEELNGG